MNDGSDSRIDDEPELDERSIAQVGSPTKQTNILVVIFGVAIVGLLLWFVNRGEQQETNARLTDPEPLQFDSPARRESPRLPDPEPTPVATNAAPQYAAPDPMQAELQRIALRRAEEQRQLMEQRRRAPILVVDKRRTQGLAGC